MIRCDVAFIGTFEADTYEECLRKAKQFADGVNIYEGTTPFSVVTDYEHDKDHQRVLYLHPVVIGYGQDENFPQVAAGEPVYTDDV